MGFRAVEIDALLRAAQIEQDRHAHTAKAASLRSDDAYPTPGRDRPDAASRAVGAPGRLGKGAAGPGKGSRRRFFVPCRELFFGLPVLGVLTAARGANAAHRDRVMTRSRRSHNSNGEK